jgi:hypothetical protein
MLTSAMHTACQPAMPLRRDFSQRNAGSYTNSVRGESSNAPQ